jgi:hypothetical protein
MSVAPLSTSPNHPVQRLTLFTNLEEDQDEEETPVPTNGSLDRLLTIPETPYAHDSHNQTLGGRSADLTEEGYALGMEYDVVLTFTQNEPRKSSYRPNAHLELMGLSASLHQPVVGRSAAFSSKRYIGSMTEVDGKTSLHLEGELSDKAVSVVHRVMDKLIGLDFENKTALEISEQIDRLIQQATSNENLSTCFSGWCAFW